MKLEVRVYKRFDMDLLALLNAGYPLSDMFLQALRAFAHKTPLFYFVDEYIPMCLSEKNSVHFRITIPDTDIETCTMIQNIVDGYKCSFCKDILRNCMLQQNVGVYFKNNNTLGVSLCNANAYNINPAMLPNVVMLSSLRNGSYEEYRDKQRKKVENKFLGKEEKLSAMPPQSNMNNAFNNQMQNPYMPMYNPYAYPMMPMQMMQGQYMHPMQGMMSASPSVMPNTPNDLSQDAYSNMPNKADNMPKTYDKSLVNDTEPVPYSYKNKEEVHNTEVQETNDAMNHAINDEINNKQSDDGIALAGDDELLSLFSNF